MKRVGPILGIAGATLIASGLLFREIHIPGELLVYNLGVLLFNFGFLPYLLIRNWKGLSSLRKTERILGIAGAFLIINGMMFKAMHWPGASIQMTMAVFVFIFGFLPLQLNLQWREATTGLQKTYAVVRFAAFFILLLGFIFKTMHWPGAGVAIATGMFMLPVYLVFYFALRMKNQGKLPHMLGDMLIATIAFFIWIFSNTNRISVEVLEGYRLMESQYVQMNTGIESANNLIYGSIDSLTGDMDESLLESIRELEHLGDRYTANADSIKDGFYRLILEGMYRETSTHLRLRASHLAILNSTGHYFIKDGNGERVKEIIDRYREGALEIADRHNISSGSIGLGLETADKVLRERLFHDMGLIYI